MKHTSAEILAYAHTLVHSKWREKNSPGPFCALFVRHVFQHCGINLPVARQPSDWQFSRSLPQGEGFANSLAGSEIGEKIPTVDLLQPGDIVLWRGTIPTISSQLISHVGIYAGHGKAYDRGSDGVEFRSINTFAHFVEGRRPSALQGSGAAGAVQANPSKVSKIAFEHGKLSCKLHGHAVTSMILGANGHGNVLVNDRISHAASFLVEMQGQDGRWHKGYSHDGRCTLIGMSSVRCAVKNGALEVHIDKTTEVKPRSLVITLVEK